MSVQTALEIATLIVSLLGAIYVYGKLAQRVEDHGYRLKNLDRRTGEVEKTLVSHAEQLAEGKGFRDGLKVGQATKS